MHPLSVVLSLCSLEAGVGVSVFLITQLCHFEGVLHGHGVLLCLVEIALKILSHQMRVFSLANWQQGVGPLLRGHRSGLAGT